MRARLLSAVRRLVQPDVHKPNMSVSEYWNHHNVTNHRAFATAEESLQYFAWRNSQYVNYLKLMPVAGFDGQRVLDFGCGPGHDLVGFGVYSKPAQLAGVDVSAASIREARARLDLHHISADVRRLEPGQPLPFADASFDHIHSSGVLHHVDDLQSTLRELKRVLRPGGSLYVMVYNHDSLWMHLLVAYHRTIVEGRYAGLTPQQQFAHSTDGEACPIANCYRADEFIAIAKAAGFNGEFAGAAVSMRELSLLNTRFDAIMDPRLPVESRRFLEALEFDQRMLPMVAGRHAGIDAVYHLRH